jgi:hypothetical protein
LGLHNSEKLVKKSGSNFYIRKQEFEGGKPCQIITLLHVNTKHCLFELVENQTILTRFSPSWPVSIFGNHWHALELDSFWQCVQKHHILYILTLDNLEWNVQLFLGCLDKNNRNPNLGLDTFEDPPFWVKFWCDFRWNLAKHDTIWRILSSLIFLFQVWSVVYNFMAVLFFSQRN